MDRPRGHATFAPNSHLLRCQRRRFFPPLHQEETKKYTALPGPQSPHWHAQFGFIPIWPKMAGCGCTGHEGFECRWLKQAASCHLESRISTHLALADQDGRNWMERWFKFMAHQHGWHVSLFVTRLTSPAKPQPPPSAPLSTGYTETSQGLHLVSQLEITFDQYANL